MIRKFVNIDPYTVVSEEYEHREDLIIDFFVMSNTESLYVYDIVDYAEHKKMTVSNIPYMKNCNVYIHKAKSLDTVPDDIISEIIRHSYQALDNAIEQIKVS